MKKRDQFALRYDANQVNTSEIIALSGDTIALTMANPQPEHPGRIVEANVRVKNVRPNRSLALAILLYELDDQDEKQLRGVRTLALPAHHADHSMNILVENLMFILPEETRKPTRRLQLRAVAHYTNL